MAKVEGQGIKSRGSYVAKEAMAKGLYWLHELEQAQEPSVPGVKVRLSPEVVALVAKQKKTGETLAAAVGVVSEFGKNRTLSERLATRDAIVKHFVINGILLKLA